MQESNAIFENGLEGMLSDLLLIFSYEFIVILAINESILVLFCSFTLDKVDEIKCCQPRLLAVGDKHQ